MKKILMMSTTIFMVTLICVVPFFVPVKAAGNLVYSTGATFNEGEYNVYTAQASTGSSLQFYFDDMFYSYDQYKTAVITKISLNDVYTGDITLTYSRISNYTDFGLFWVDADQGSCGIDGSGKTFTLHLYGVQSLTFYQTSTITSTNNLQPDGISTTLITQNSILDSLSGYQIPMEQLMAFVFTSTDPNTIEYTNGDLYPHFNVSAGTLGQNTSFAVPARNQRLHYVFISSVNHNSNPLVGLNGPTDLTFTISAITPFTFSGYRLYDMQIVNPTSAATTSRLYWMKSASIYPIFFGYEDQMSNQLRELMGLGTDTDRLVTLLTAISGNVNNIYNYLTLGDSSTSNQVTEDIDDVTGDLTDIFGNINDITDAIDVDFNSHINDIDLDDNDFFTGLTTTTEFFKYYAGEFYTSIGDMKALLIVPIIVTIMMMIAGWML